MKLIQESKEYKGSGDVYVYNLSSYLQETISNKTPKFGKVFTEFTKCPKKIEFNPMIKNFSSYHVELLQIPTFLKDRNEYAITSFQHDVYIHGGCRGKKSEF
jgi:hypothetical protein